MGLRVVDFSQIAAGPFCTMLLADMGADVIKVEPPGGDVARALGPPFVDGESATFLALNRNKRSVVLDLKSAVDLQHARALTGEADVVIESFRPGVADRLGIGYRAIAEYNPSVIYCSVSAYGQTGPWADRPGVDGALQAVTGLMSITGSEREPPSKVQAPVVDMVTGYQAVIAILAALQKRRLGAQLAPLDVSLFASSVMLQQIPLASFLISGELPKRSGSGAPYATPNEAYETADGYILVAAYQDARWRRLCSTIGRAELSTDRRFATLEQRMAHRSELTETLNAVFRGRSSAAWLDELEKADIICAPIATYSDLAMSEQLKVSGILSTISHPTIGLIVMPGFAIGGRSIPIRLAPPTLGQHTNHMLKR